MAAGVELEESSVEKAAWAEWAECTPRDQESRYLPAHFQFLADTSPKESS